MRLLEELIRLVAYGGVGAFTGFLAGIRVADQHRLVATVLNEAERDVPAPLTRRRRWRNNLPTLAILLVMVAMLLTALAWLQTGIENTRQDRESCLRAVEITQTLRSRTETYLHGASAELIDDRADLAWKRAVRAELLRLGVGTDSPFIRATDEAIRAQEESMDSEEAYLEHLRRNPYPRATEDDC